MLISSRGRVPGRVGARTRYPHVYEITAYNTLRTCVYVCFLVFLSIGCEIGVWKQNGQFEIQSRTSVDSSRCAQTVARGLSSQ